ncbi:hypothetical protein A6A08_25805 [Nocardiopsis sp. TSRI0078]|uniref:DUF1761 domain-containing protein n=1 Tax=unclassified Nocardiopsis TaxID=2649073 RepID=UPI00093A4272|nr:DUF1761 domain-containing protein [Nocardiopsis sp. TSRI0078]OKI17553.1 hypothetical protein A6A08_25805 [Nocardiopsis sp. TSRI0078]
MIELDFLAIAVAAVAAFVVSGVWYGVFARQLKELSSSAEPKPLALLLPVELVRNAVVTTVMAGLASVSGTAGLSGTLALGLALWTGFPLVLLVGSIFHESVPWRIAALHAGDWLVKLLAISAVIALWP